MKRESLVKISKETYNNGMAIPPEPPKKDWEAIAKEIWDDLDILSLYLESHYNDDKIYVPMFKKLLPRRFKHFYNYKGRTVTSEEYEKLIEKDKEISEMMYKNHQP